MKELKRNNKKIILNYNKLIKKLEKAANKTKNQYLKYIYLYTIVLYCDEIKYWENNK